MFSSSNSQILQCFSSVFFLRAIVREGGDLWARVLQRGGGEGGEKGGGEGGGGRTFTC